MAIAARPWVVRVLIPPWASRRTADEAFRLAEATVETRGFARELDGARGELRAKNPTLRCPAQELMRGLVPSPARLLDKP
jgi:hypothetical protein